MGERSYIRICVACGITQYSDFLFLNTYMAGNSVMCRILSRMSIR